MLQIRFGVVLIGPSGSGKTTVWQILRRALEIASLEDDTGKTLLNITVLNPKSVERSKLFGYIDEYTREWHDGLFPRQSRQIARDDMSGSIYWIIFDGDIDPDWVEALNSVLDDNRVLTLPSGERIDFDFNKCRILFETTSLKFASPATISRLGVVCIDTVMINEMVQCYIAKNQLELSMLTIADSFLQSQIDQSKCMLISTTRTLMEHLKFCHVNREDDVIAIQRIEGRVPFLNEDNIETELLNNLVITETVNRCVELLKPLTDEHLCLIGPVGSGKSTLVRELIFLTNGQSIAIDCTPNTGAVQLTKVLLNSCATILTGSNRTLRPTSGEQLWIFIRHFELLTYDKWSSNSLVSLLVMLLKHHGFYHPDTFEWIQVEKFQIIITCTDLKFLDERLLTSMHVIMVTYPSLMEIEQILFSKAKLINSTICEYFPSKYVELIRLVQHVLSELNEGSIMEFDYLMVAIDILKRTKHYKVIDESIILFEMCCGLKNLFVAEKLDHQLKAIFEQEFSLIDGLPTTVYTSINGSKLFDSMELNLFRQHLNKLIKVYFSENDLQVTDWELLPQTVNMAIELCSFLADDNDCTQSILFMVGPCGVGRKCLAKIVAHNFGYDRVWTPNSIISERHLINELRSLVATEDNTDTSGTNQKLLLLVDEIHFEILPFLRDQLYFLLCSETQTSNQLRLIITASEVNKLDRLIWLRKARLHLVRPFSVSCYDRWTKRILSGCTVSFTEQQVCLFYQIFSHFGTQIKCDFSRRQLENIHFYTGFVKTFIDLFNRQLAVLNEDSERLQLGVAKLNQVSNQVSTLKDDAFKQKQLLDTKRSEADDAFNLIMNSMHESEDKKFELEDVQKRIEVETVTLNERKSKIHNELEQIEPVLQSVKAAVGGIRSDALSEIRSLRAPPEVIRDILEGVLRLMGVNDTSWISMKTFLSKRGVKEDIMNFDCHKITPAIRIKVEQLLDSRSESFQPAVAKRASAAAALLAEWVKANVQYSKVLHEIAPLEQELKTLESGMVRAQSKLKTLNLQLEGVDTEVDSLRARMQAVTVEAAQIELNLRNTNRVLEQSETLVNDLSDEHRRWTNKLQQIEAEMKHLIERCIVTSAYMVYAGSEPSYSRRSQLLQKCFEQFSIEPFELNQFMSVSCEEELFFAIPSRGIVPLICDPAHKALKLIDNYEYTRLKSSDCIKVLELSIRFGRTLVIDDFTQLDINLVPLVFANIYGTFETRFWTFIGDRKVDYNPKFRLFLLTENISTHKQLPLWLFRIVNMSPSFSSITAQLLRLIIDIKRPELEQEKNQVELGVRTLQQQLKQLEAELLEKLSNETGNILENVQLIEKLKFLKSSALKVEKSLQESDKLRQDLELERKQYENIAQFVANLFFSIENLPKLNPMYYVGYVEFERLFKWVLKQNTNDFDNDKFCYIFYCHVSQALFVEHRRCLRHYILSNFPDTSSRISSTTIETSRTIGEFITDIHERIDTNECEHLLILTTPGADPTTEIQNTVTRLGYELKMISMGSDVIGQVDTMLQSHIVNKSKQALCLCNLHLVVNWLPRLCEQLQSLTNVKPNPIQLIVLVSETNHCFPTNLLEMCTKFAYESMPGVRNHLRRLRASAENISDFMLNKTNSKQFNDLLSIQEIFHVICCERRYYIPFGWTKNYEISFNEFLFGRNVIQKLFQLNTKSTIDRKQLYQYIYGLFCDVIYGGKVDFDVDQNVLSLLLKRYFDYNIEIASTLDLQRKFIGNTEGDLNEFSVLILPLNIDTFRNKTNEQRLQVNLQLLQSRKMVDDDSFKLNKSKPTLQPSGIGYFQKLWKRILVKCKIDQVESVQASGSSSQHYLDTNSWNSLIEQFIQMEIHFAKRLFWQIENDLNSKQASSVTENSIHQNTINQRLVENKTPDSWQLLWLGGPDVAQDYLVTLARIYIRLTRPTTITKQQQTIFDITACFHPKLLLNSLLQFAASRFQVCVDQLLVNSKWTIDGDDSATTQWNKTADRQDINHVEAFLDGIWIEGALFEAGRLQECLVDSPFTSKMPVLCLTISSHIEVSKNKSSTQRLSTVMLPLYTSTERRIILQHLSVPCLPNNDDRWLQMGVAFVLGNFIPILGDQ